MSIHIHLQYTDENSLDRMIRKNALDWLSCNVENAAKEEHVYSLQNVAKSSFRNRKQTTHADDSIFEE